MTLPDTLQAFHVMAKPTGSDCNLNCAYCFFLKKEGLYPGSDFRMSDEVHEAYIRQLMEAHHVPQVTVAWQGGSPVSPDYGPRGNEFSGEVNWVEIDVDKDAEDFDHLITPEERLQIAMAIQ